MMNVIIDEILDRLNKSNIISLGDSHSMFFRELDKITIHHIGPALAYHINSDVSTNNTKSQIFNILKQSDSSKTIFILSFGEIDIRVHILKRAIIENISIEESTIRVAKKYIEMLELLNKNQYQIFVYGPHASGFNPDETIFPYNGTVEERNYATIVFNSYLEEFCDLNRIPFVSLSDIFIDKETYATDFKCMSDRCHLDHNPELQEIVLSRFLSKVEDYYAR